jgi:hypothetical protein
MWRKSTFWNEVSAGPIPTRARAKTGGLGVGQTVDLSLNDARRASINIHAFRAQKTDEREIEALRDLDGQG